VGRDRSENLISTGFARDYHMTGDLAVDKNGKMLALRVHLDSDNGAFFSDAQPSKFKAGLFHIVTGSYDIPTAHVTADGYYTNKAPGGVAFRCSFRVTEASYLIERLVTNAAIELGSTRPSSGSGTSSSRSSSLHVGDRVGVRQRRLPQGDGRSPQAARI